MVHGHSLNTVDLLVNPAFATSPRETSNQLRDIIILDIVSIEIVQQFM